MFFGENFGYRRNTELGAGFVDRWVRTAVSEWGGQGGGMGQPDCFGSAAISDRKNIRRWLILSLVKRASGGQPDTVLRPIRDILKNDTGEFPLQAIRERYKGTTKSLEFTDDDVENLLYSKYGVGYTFSTLVLLYPTLDFRNKFHVDHILPRSVFTRAKLLKRGVSPDDVEFFGEQADQLSNLQLLEGLPNQEKSDLDFQQWLNKNHPEKGERTEYLSRNYIPDIDLSIANFREFIGFYNFSASIKCSCTASRFKPDPQFLSGQRTT
jgi:hypothetical protein